MRNKQNIGDRIMQLFDLTKEFVFFLGALILFFAVMYIWGHQEHQPIWAFVLVVFSIAKIYVLIAHTFKKIDSLTDNDHSFNHMLLLFGTIIIIVVLSFTMDYLCVSEIYPEAFSGLQESNSILSRFMNLLYFSVVTYTTVGYGDITPVAPLAKLITVFEMITAFVMVIFVLSKYFRNK